MSDHDRLKRAAPIEGGNSARERVDEAVQLGVLLCPLPRQLQLPKGAKC